MNTEHFKELLEEEKKNLEAELASVGRRNPEIKGDWEAIGKNPDDEQNVDKAEEGEVAENMQEFDDNRSILETLETKLSDVNEALQKIENGTYGKCDICGENIEEDRLEAEPTAKTCKVHM